MVPTDSLPLLGRPNKCPNDQFAEIFWSSDSGRPTLAKLQSEHISCISTLAVVISADCFHRGRTSLSSASAAVGSRQARLPAKKQDISFSFAPKSGAAMIQSYAEDERPVKRVRRQDITRSSLQVVCIVMVG